MHRAAIVLLLVLFAAAPARAEVRDVEVHPGSGLGEPQIHINPKDPSNLVVGENDSGVSVSRDGGATWKQVALPNPGDNVLAVQPSGTFLYSALDGHVHSSSDGGATWTTVGNWVGQVAAQQATGDTGAGAVARREVSCSSPEPEGPAQPSTEGPGPQIIGCDRPWLVADPQTGRAFVSFAAHDEGSGGWELGTLACRATVLTNPAFECGRQYVSASGDGGRTWSDFRPTDSADHPAAVTGGFSGGPVAAHGVLATAYASGDGVVFETSTDDGVSWRRHVIPGAKVAPAATVETEGSRLFQPYSAADPSRPGRYAVMTFDAAQRTLLVHVTDDSGATWQGPARVAESESATRYVPWIAYGPTGALGVAWKTVTGEDGFAMWGAVSPTGDTAFAPPVRLSSAPSPGAPTQLAGDDASDVTLDDRALHAVWGDRRGGSLGIRAARYPFAADPAAQAVAQPRACVSRRGFRIRLARRALRGRRVRSVSITLNGRRLPVLRGRRIRSFVALRGLPRGAYTVRITVRLRGGRALRGTRVYRTCAARQGGRAVINL